MLREPWPTSPRPVAHSTDAERKSPEQTLAAGCALLTQWTVMASTRRLIIQWRGGGLLVIHGAPPVLRDAIIGRYYALLLCAPRSSC
jgi:hypothetical protein